MTFVSRADWGARKGGSLSSLNVSTVTIHWGGTPLGAIPHSKCAGVVRSYQNYHLDGQGWADIAYNLLVCQHGDVFEGRGVGKRSAANGDGPSNSASYAICYIGGTGDPFTDAGKDGINAAAEMLVPGTRFWKLHGDWVDTDCPGTVIRNWVRAGHPRATPVPVLVIPTPKKESSFMFVFDAPAERGGGAWKSDGVFRNRITNGHTWPALEALGVPHIGIAPIGLFDDLIDASK